MNRPDALKAGTTLLGSVAVPRVQTPEQTLDAFRKFYPGKARDAIERPVSLSLNINNIFDQEYFRALSPSAGDWGEGRSFRLAARFEL